MTSPAFVEIVDVRNFLDLQDDGSSRYSDDTIHSNIYAASEFLERATNRYFAARSGVTLTYTTNGEASVDLPGVRSVTSVTRAGAALTADETYWLLPDPQQSGLSTGLQLQPFGIRGGPWYLSSPEWYDRNLDSPYYRGSWGSLPNDLVIVADVGYADADIPQALKLATKALAAYFTKRPDAVLSGATFSAAGSAFNLEELPVEVRMFVQEWRIGSHMAVSVG